MAARGRFIVAVSGGHTPWQMLRALAGEEVPWEGVHVVQVDERVAPAGDPDRNLTHLHESLLEHAPLRPEQIYAMPVESPTWRPRPSATPRLSRRSPARRRCSTSPTWASDLTATLPRWCLGIRSLTSPTQTLR